MVSESYAKEYERGKSLDTKLAALLAGVVASIGFSFRTNSNVVVAGATMLYLIPLLFIAFGYTTRLDKNAPSAASLEMSFPAYPVSTLIEAIKAMRIANVQNVETHDRKAGALDRAVLTTVLATFVILLLQLLIATKVIRV